MNTRFSLPVMLLCLITSLLLGAEVKNDTIPKDTFLLQEWNEVDSLYFMKNKPKSAQKILDVIVVKAKKAQRSDHYLRTVLYQLEINKSSKENSIIKNYDYLLNEIAQTSFPQDRLLHIEAARTLKRQYQNVRYQNRTSVEITDTTNLLHLSAEQVQEKILSHLRKAVSTPEKLYAISISDWYGLFKKGGEDSLYRPTLLDYLTYEVIDEFKYYDREKEKTLGSDVLLPLEMFLNHDFSQKKEQNLSFEILGLYQNLLREHEKSGNLYALAHAEMNRINYVRYYNSEYKLSPKLQIPIESLAKKCRSIDIYSEVITMLAEHINDKRSVESDSIKFQKYNDEMLTLIDTAINTYPKSIGAAKAINFKHRLCQPKLDVDGEDITTSNSSYRLNLSYQNTKAVKVTLYPISEEEYLNWLLYEYRHKDTVDILQHPPDTSWKYDLTYKRDFQERSTVLPVPNLTSGAYLITVESIRDSVPGLTYEKEIVYAPVLATSLFAVENKMSHSEEMTEFFICDRTSGKPVKDAKIEFFKINRNDKISEKPLKTIETNENGIAHIKGKELSARNPLIRVSQGDEWVYSNARMYYYNYNRNYKEKRLSLFSDRAIYRPGQTIHFKGIATQHKSGSLPKIIASEKMRLLLHPPSGKPIDTIEATTNKFGSLSGSFTIPIGSLPGHYSIAIERNYNNRINGYLSIQVEEYKRPTFQILMDTLDTEKRLGDSIEVTGTVQSFAGFGIDDASITYTVKRITKYPDWRWHYFGYGNYQSPQPVTLTSGKINTKLDGTFTIPFRAIPDEKSDLSLKPSFTYAIEVKATSSSGETHEEGSSITIGTEAFQLSISSPDIFHSNDKKITHYIGANTFNGKALPVDCELLLYECQGPKRATHKGNKYTQNYSRHLFKHTLSEEEFTKHFPYHPYSEEVRKEKFPNGKLIYKKKLKTSKDSLVTVSIKKRLSTGFYRVVVRGVEKNSEIETQKVITLFNNKTVPVDSLFWYHTSLKEFEPGDTAVLYFGSPIPGTHVKYQLLQRQKLIDEKHISIDKGIHIIRIPITESLRGNFTATLTTVIDGELFTRSQEFTVPWTNKKLNVKLETFSSVLEPGAKDSWKIRISGKKKEQVAAELLLTLYDGSLDAILKHGWHFNPHPTFYSSNLWIEALKRRWRAAYQYYSRADYRSIAVANKTFAKLVNSREYRREVLRRKLKHLRAERAGKAYTFGDAVVEGYMDSPTPFYITDADRSSVDMAMESAAPSSSSISAEEEQLLKQLEELEGKKPLKVKRPGGAGASGVTMQPVTIRKDFSETALFLPHLKTDSTGDIIVDVTMPEAITSWKLLGLAHTKDVDFGFLKAEFVTQKQLMILPNVPRFFREGDSCQYAVQIKNLSDSTVSGTCSLELIDFNSMKPIDTLFSKEEMKKSFSSKAGSSTTLAWNLVIPSRTSPVICRVIADGGTHSDGEERVIPILKNSRLITESMPISIRGKEKQGFTMGRFKASFADSSIEQFGLTFEYTPHPVWSVVQALPALTNHGHKSSLCNFYHYYTNTLAKHIIESNPRIKEVYEAWEKDTTALASNLEKNPELKTLLLEQTPWVWDAENEKARKKQVALLFKSFRMKGEIRKSLRKLENLQQRSGGWAWYPGMEENLYITQYITTGLIHLEELGAVSDEFFDKHDRLVNNSIRFLDSEIVDDYNYLKARTKEFNSKWISAIHIHYLYTRTYRLLENPIPKHIKEAYTFYLDQARVYNVMEHNYLRGMLALALHRTEHEKEAVEIMESIDENAIHSIEMGMYWKSSYGYFWYETSLETQAILIEAYADILKDTTSVNDMKTWLLQQKKTTDWGSPRATAEAAYALLLHGSDWLQDTLTPKVSVGSIEMDTISSIKEEGTGYYKHRWEADKLIPEMATVNVESYSSQPSWGALHWQYFQQLDKITANSDNPLVVTKELYLVSDSIKTPVKSVEKPISIGDKVLVRVTLTANRDMEFIHMKDMRASAFEPTTVLSGTKYQNGLWYYQTTKDASTDFFFDRVRKGTYVFEYELLATQVGTFSNGITTLESYFNPEYRSHSNGIKVKVIGREQ